MSLCHTLGHGRHPTAVGPNDQRASLACDQTVGSAWELLRHLLTKREVGLVACLDVSHKDPCRAPSKGCLWATFRKAHLSPGSKSKPKQLGLPIWSPSPSMAPDSQVLAWTAFLEKGPCSWWGRRKSKNTVFLVGSVANVARVPTCSAFCCGKTKRAFPQKLAGAISQHEIKPGPSRRKGRQVGNGTSFPGALSVPFRSPTLPISPEPFAQRLAGAGTVHPVPGAAPGPRTTESTDSAKGRRHLQRVSGAAKPWNRKKKFWAGGQQHHFQGRPKKREAGKTVWVAIFEAGCKQQMN